MTVSSSAVSVTTTATVLNTSETDQIPRYSVAVYNSSAVTVYVGGSAVTTSTGFPVAAAGSFSVDLDKGEGLWGIVATGTASVIVLSQGI
jgi:hypothetical protein